MAISSPQGACFAPFRTPPPQRQGNLYYHKSDTSGFVRMLNITEGLINCPSALKQFVPSSIATPILDAVKDYRLQADTLHLNKWANPAAIPKPSHTPLPANDVIGVNFPNQQAPIKGGYVLQFPEPVKLKTLTQKIPNVKRMREVRLGVQGYENSQTQFAPFNATIQYPLETLVHLVANHKGINVQHRNTAKVPGFYPYSVDFMDMLNTTAALRH